MRFCLAALLVVWPLSAGAHGGDEDADHAPMWLSLGLESAWTADETHMGVHIGIMGPLTPELQLGLHSGFTVFTDRAPAPMIGAHLEWTLNPLISLVASGECTLVQPAPEFGMAGGVEVTLGDYFGGSLAVSGMFGQHWLMSSAYRTPTPSELLFLIHLHLVIDLELP